MLSRPIANAIGLVREAQAHNKRSKSPQPVSDDTAASLGVPAKSRSPFPAPSPDLKGDAKITDESDSDFEADEELWTVDEIQPSANDVKSSLSEAKSIDEILATFKSLHPPPRQQIRNANMSCPVIIPQRRPRARDRGFIRAYAPSLEEVGISQPTFFDFLDGFERAIRLHPIFHGVNAAVFAGARAIEIAAGPSVTLHAVAFTLHASVEGSRRLMIFHEVNRYLDGINEVLFKPRGLYALIMTYKPESNKAIEDIGPSDGVTESVMSRNEGAGGKFSRSSGTTRGEIEIPEAAPLVFPELDSLSTEEQESRMAKARGFMGDYSDRRARARYDAANPESKLSVPGTEFASRYSDPTGPAASGGLIGLVSGGKLTGRRYRRRQRRNPGGQRPSRGPRRVLQQDVYYLMIVNMPTDAELHEAQKAQSRAL